MVGEMAPSDHLRQQVGKTHQAKRGMLAWASLHWPLQLELKHDSVTRQQASMCAAGRGLPGCSIASVQKSAEVVDSHTPVHRHALLAVQLQVYELNAVWGQLPYH